MNQESISVTYIGTTCNIQHRRIHHPVRKVTHSTTQNSGVAGRGGAREGDDGLRNYECFPSSHLPHAKCSPWKGKAQPHAKCSPWKGKTACEMPLLERKSTAACEMPLLERKSTAACEMLPLERENRMRNAPSRKGIHFQLISC